MAEFYVEGVDYDADGVPCRGDSICVEASNEEGQFLNLSQSFQDLIFWDCTVTKVDILPAIKPKTVLFLGKCGGLRDKNRLGDYILPSAAIRGEGTSNDYFPPEIPALPAFSLQRSCFVKY